MMIDALTSALQRYTYRFTTEADLHRAITAALQAENYLFQREFILSPRDRLDFLATIGADRVAIEVKVGGQLGALARQVQRYASSPSIDGVVVVSSRVSLCALPDTMAGKPVRTVYVGGQI